jgi:hypothetical protein
MLFTELGNEVSLNNAFIFLPTLFLGLCMTLNIFQGNLLKGPSVPIFFSVAGSCPSSTFRSALAAWLRALARLNSG